MSFDMAAFSNPACLGGVAMSENFVSTSLGCPNGRSDFGSGIDERDSGYSLSDYGASNLDLLDLETAHAQLALLKDEGMGFQNNFVYLLTIANF
jgi:hypothetical protein